MKVKLTLINETKEVSCTMEMSQYMNIVPTNIGYVINDLIEQLKCEINKIPSTET